MENNNGIKSFRVGYDKSKNNKNPKSAKHNKVNSFNKKIINNIDKFKMYDNSKSVNLEGYSDYDKFNFIENTSVLDLSEVISEDNIPEEYSTEPILLSSDGSEIINNQDDFTDNITADSNDIQEELLDDILDVETSDLSQEVVSVSDVKEIEEDEITEILELDEIKYEDTNSNDSLIPEIITESVEPIKVMENSNITNDNNIDNVSDMKKINVSYDGSNKAVNTKKTHFGFEMRVILMGTITIICFVCSIVLCYQAINYSDIKNIFYNERSSVTYSVCLNDNDYYKGKCQSSGMQYISTLTKSIPVVFNYNVSYTSSVNYNLDYYVLGKTIVYDRDDSSKVLYRDDKIISKRESVSGTNVSAMINTRVDIAFKEKNDFVNGYKSKYALNSLAKYDVVLYVDDGKGPREVASISIPLSLQTFGVSQETITNENQEVAMEKAGLSTINTVFGIFGVLFGLVGAVVLVKLFKLIYKTVDGNSVYEKKLNRILTEYDRVIVISKSEYVINPDKQFVKLDSFFELLDARDTLEKPIIYEKVNNVKSFFYVEDDDRIYRYTMKESDFEKK